MDVSFEYFDEEKKNQLTSFRVGEQKLAQIISTVSSLEALTANDSGFVVIGLAEDVGVQENLGIAGAASAWPEFLKAFLNIQHNGFIDAQELTILGHWRLNEGHADPQTIIQALDDSLTEQIRQIVAMNKIPIVIGGGHNNAYGMIKGFSKGKNKAVNIINLDPHADLRTMEKRHSGNGFSFALTEQYLNKYFILGLHEAYNNTHILEQIQNNPSINALFLEDIYLRKKFDWEAAIDTALAFVQGGDYGLELDMDAIENTLSSAMTPLGVSVREAARFLYKAGRQAAYLHLPEGIFKRADGLEQKTIGKLQSYLVQAFIKGRTEQDQA